MSGRGTTWYKRDPIRFLDGVEGMGPELIGAYAYLLDLIYARNGYSRRDDKALGGRMGCSTRKAQALTDALIERGKVEVEGEFLTHKHAKNHAKLSRDLSETLARHGRDGGEKSGRVRKNKKLGEAYPSSENEAEQIREDIETTVDASASTSVSAQQAENPPDLFEVFWDDAYPHRNGAKKGKALARKRWDAAVKAGADPQAIIAAAVRFQQDRQAISGYSPDPATWLNQSRWEDEIEPVPTKGSRHAKPDRTGEAAARAERIAARVADGLKH